jgi:uncharacterized protein
MNIAIDLDDVTVQLTVDLTKEYNRQFNTSFTQEDHTVFDLSKVWKCSPEDMMEFVYSFYRSPIMKSLPPVPGAVEGITALSKHNSVCFITSRPEFTKQLTLDWLHTHFPKQDMPVYFTNQFALAHDNKVKKSDICKQMGVEVIIEDGPAYAVDCSENNIIVFLIDRPWNQSVEENDNIIRVKTWKEVLSNLNHALS